MPDPIGHLPADPSLMTRITALMQDRPGMPLSAVATESGFSSESTFFRNFKALTGKTPLQWLSEFS